MINPKRSRYITVTVTLNVKYWLCEVAVMHCVCVWFTLSEQSRSRSSGGGSISWGGSGCSSGTQRWQSHSCTGRYRSSRKHSGLCTRMWGTVSWLCVGDCEIVARYCIFNLAELYRATGREEEASSLAKHALEIQELARGWSPYQSLYWVYWWSSKMGFALNKYSLNVS